MSEARLVNKIKKELESRGAYHEKIFGGGYQSAGVPDILACYKGLFVGIEVKSPDGKGRASDIQKIKIKEIRDGGGVAFITDSLDDVIYVLDCIDTNYSYVTDNRFVKIMEKYF